jgi:hypothetical protein
MLHSRANTGPGVIATGDEEISPGLYRGTRKTFSIKTTINIKSNSSLDLGPAAAKLQLLTKIARRGGEARCVFAVLILSLTNLFYPR